MCAALQEKLKASVGDDVVVNETDARNEAVGHLFAEYGYVVSSVCMKPQMAGGPIKGCAPPNGTPNHHTSAYKIPRLTC